MLELITAVAVSAASTLVSASALYIIRLLRKLVEMTEQIHTDLRGAEPEDPGIVHFVRQHRAVLRENGELDRRPAVPGHRTDGGPEAGDK